MDFTEVHYGVDLADIERKYEEYSSGSTRVDRKMAKRLVELERLAKVADSGETLIDLERTLRNSASRGPDALPRLAVAPAPRGGRQCFCTITPSGVITLGPGVGRLNWFVFKPEYAPRRFWTSARALVPPVPPTLRPKTLRKFVTIWEPVWTHKRVMEGPSDPGLLERVSDQGHLFRVVETWDLTPAEREALRGI